MTPLILGGVLLFAMIYCAVTERDMWPFSHYPMFSHPRKVSDVACYRLAMETHDGKKVWWRSRFDNYEQALRKELHVILGASPENRSPAIYRKLMLRMINLVSIDGDLGDYQKVHVVCRRMIWEEARFILKEETVLTLTVDDLIKEAFS